MIDDDYDDIMSILMESLELTEKQARQLIDKTTDDLVAYCMDMNLNDPSIIMSSLGIELTDDELTEALEESEERVSRISPAAPVILSVGRLAAHAVHDSFDDDIIPDEVKEGIAEMLGDIAIRAGIATITQLRRRGDIVYMWELEDIR